MSMPTDTLKADAQPWECLGPIAAGGTVYGLAISPVRRVLGVLVAPTPHVPLYWAVTPCGSFRSYTSGYHWDQILDGLTTPLLSAVAVALNGALFAGALDGSLFLSDDFGLSWQPGHVPKEVRAPITAMVASPNFRKDRAVFAGTQGAGVLVTRDGGRHWQQSNFGLDSALVLALAVTPDWSEQETIFAATPQGVRVSLNGGRAWRATGLIVNDDVVDALAVSPAFGSDRTVYAGTEAGSLYQSPDGGHTWELLQKEIGGGPLSALWLAPDFAKSGRMVSAVGSSIYVSSDRGQSWRLAAELPNSILALTGDERSVIVGLAEAGVWESRDAGLTWHTASGDLSARDFTWLKALGSRLYAVGPQEGIWVSEDGARRWRRLEGLASHLPLTATCMSSERAFLVASHSGKILRSTDGGEIWHQVGEAQRAQAVNLVPETGDGWIGTARGELLTSHDYGATWLNAPAPCPGQPIVSIAASPRYAEDHSLLLGTFMAPGARQPGRVVVWRSTDGGATWRQIATQTTSAGWLDIAMASGIHGDPSAQALLATGPHLLHRAEHDGQSWTSTTVDPSGANILSLARAGKNDHSEVAFAATGNGVYRSIDGGRSWESFMEGLESRTYMSLALVPGEQSPSLYALSLGGVIWKRQL